MMDRTDLERMDREGLVLRAQAAGIRRARVLTRPELIDELLRLDPVFDETQLKKTRGFFGRARDLLSRVVERGLHLPDAADRLRATMLGDSVPPAPRPEPQAVPTVTLAEIYAAQGHKQRAIETLKRVLEAEPEHGAARALLEKLQASDYVGPAPSLPPEPEVEEPPKVEEPPMEDEIGAQLESAEGVEPADTVGAVAQREPAPATPRVGEPSTLQPPTSLRAGRPKEEEAEAPLLTQAECIAIPIEHGSSYVWWRVFGKHQAPPGSFVVRAVILTPTWDGPEQQIRDVPCELDAGELVLRGLPESAIVRVAVGHLEGDLFTPIAHSPALEMTPARGLVCWTLEGAVPVGLDDPRASSIAFAADRAARVSG